MMRFSGIVLELSWTFRGRSFPLTGGKKHSTLLLLPLCSIVLSSSYRSYLIHSSRAQSVLARSPKQHEKNSDDHTRLKSEHA
jgi:hypothetical protein